MNDTMSIALIVVGAVAIYGGAILLWLRPGPARLGVGTAAARDRRARSGVHGRGRLPVTRAAAGRT
jgi:hypothetical protein